MRKKPIKTVATRKTFRSSAKLYCCGIAWETEIDPANADAIDFYASVASLKSQKCHKNCGIVEVEIRLNRWLKKPRYLETFRGARTRVGKTKGSRVGQNL